jgi:hypothetical protein
VLPASDKVEGSVDRVNGQLDKVDRIECDLGQEREVGT